LIVTGDDFGLSIPINEAVSQTHQKGILTSTSLMVAAPEVNDAVARARGIPTLNVGLHLVLSNGRSCLPASDIPDLVNADGQFSNNLVISGIKMFFMAKMKQQLKDEIRAQFEAFKATGLRLDHVNTHNHMHLHPTVFDAIIEVGKDYGMEEPGLNIGLSPKSPSFFLETGRQKGLICPYHLQTLKDSW